MGFRIADNLDGVNALRELASGLEQAKDDINAAVDVARGVVSDNRLGLGSYADRADDLFKDIDDSLAESIHSIEKMKTALNGLASDLLEYIEATSGMTVGGGSGK